MTINVGGSSFKESCEAGFGKQEVSEGVSSWVKRGGKAKTDLFSSVMIGQTDTDFQLPSITLICLASQPENSLQTKHYNATTTQLLGLRTCFVFH